MTAALPRGPIGRLEMYSRPFAETALGRGAIIPARFFITAREGLK